MLFRISTCILAGALVWGQEAPPPAAAQRLQKMVQQLNLTEPQKEKILPILLEEAPKVKAIKADTAMPQNQKIVKMLEIRNETSDKIRPILTPQQQGKLDAMRQKQRQQVIQELRHR